MNVCIRCGNCCKTINNEKLFVLIYPFELKKIADNLHMTEIEFLITYCCKDYIEINKDNKIDIYVLKQKKNQCIFLNEKNECSIYPFRPIQCEKAPYNYFSKEKVWKHMICIDYQDLKEANSLVSDKELVCDLLSGYKL